MNDPCYIVSDTVMVGINEIDVLRCKIRSEFRTCMYPSLWAYMYVMHALQYKQQREKANIAKKQPPPKKKKKRKRKKKEESIYV